MFKNLCAQTLAQKEGGWGVGRRQELKKGKERVETCAVNVVICMHEDKIFYVIAVRLTNV
jgi:hypothetical protein